MLFLPQRAKQGCTCFLQRGQHEFNRIVKSDGTDFYVCTVCGAPAEEAIRAEEEYMVAWHAGEESKYLKSLEGRTNLWGRHFPWRS